MNKILRGMQHIFIDIYIDVDIDKVVDASPKSINKVAIQDTKNVKKIIEVTRWCMINS